MLPTLRFMFRIKTEVQQGVVVHGTDEINSAAMPAIATGGSTAWHKFLPAKSQAAITAVARFYQDSYFIDHDFWGTP